MLLCPFARNSFIGPPRSASLKVLVTLTKKNPPSDPRQDTSTPSGKVRAAPVLGTYSILFVPVSARSSFAANRLLWGSPTLLGQAPCPVGRLARRHRGMEFRLSPATQAKEPWSNSLLRETQRKKSKERKKRKAGSPPASLANTAQTLARPVSLRRGGESSLDAPLIRYSAYLAVIRNKAAQLASCWCAALSAFGSLVRVRAQRLHTPSVLSIGHHDTLHRVAAGTRTRDVGRPSPATPLR